MAELLQSNIATVTVEDTFTDSVEISAEERIVGMLTETESLSFISLSADEIIPEINITDSFSGDNLIVALSGNHVFDIFDQNEILSIPRGSSDRIDTPLTSNGFEDLDPDERQVYKFVVDQRTITVTYTLTYAHRFPSEDWTISTDTFTQNVENNFNVPINTFLQYI